MIFALVGNQNCGKTTLFNALTGSNQHVGNFPGVTVDQKMGEMRDEKGCSVVDLPGIYSLRPYTQEEIVSRDFIINEKPDGIINIVDATNIERNLYLTLQLLELLARVDVVLRRYNKTDAVIEIGGLRIDTRAMQVWRGAEEIALTHKEYDLLLFFARNPGTALYRETIYEHVWGGEYSYGSKTVDLHIQRLRKKVGWENRLLAVNKVGYRLEV